MGNQGVTRDGQIVADPCAEFLHFLPQHCFGQELAFNVVQHLRLQLFIGA